MVELEGGCIVEFICLLCDGFCDFWVVVFGIYVLEVCCIVQYCVVVMGGVVYVFCIDEQMRFFFELVIGCEWYLEGVEVVWFCSGVVGYFVEFFEGIMVLVM